MAYESGNVRPGANTIIDIYSLFLNCKFFVSTVILSSCNLNCKQKKKKKLTCSNTSIILIELLNMLYIISKTCPLTNLSLHVLNKH